MPYIYECIILLSAYVYVIVLFVLMERSPAGGQDVGDPRLISAQISHLVISSPQLTQ